MRVSGPKCFWISPMATIMPTRAWALARILSFRTYERLRSVPTKLIREITNRKTRLNRDKAITKAKPLFRSTLGSVDMGREEFIGLLKIEPKD